MLHSLYDWDKGKMKYFGKVFRDSTDPMFTVSILLLIFPDMNDMRLNYELDN